MVQSNVDRVGRILLLGSSGKRKTYFEAAIASSGMEYGFYSYEDFEQLLQGEDLMGTVLKIDPPEIHSIRIDEIEQFTREYDQKLRRLSEMPVLEFWNTPASILQLLDKKNCKKALLEKGIPVTKMYEINVSSAEELLHFMEEQRIPQLFVKPLTGSGAAGVTAVRFVPKRNQLVVYSCAALDQGILVNTKRLSRLEQDAAKSLLDALLQNECILEKWHRKACYEGYSYDLRVVVQNGQVDYILPRLSKGPVTNLHLNNHAEYFESLKLDVSLTEEIKRICCEAVGCFPGLRGAGIDVLIENGKPYIIEMNAQGDLIYQDIFHENRIYNQQIAAIKGDIRRR